MKIIFITYLFLIFTSNSIWASKNHSHHHKHTLKAHAHETAKLQVALEANQKLNLELTISGSDVVGFEHPAKSEKELKSVESAKQRIKMQLLEALGLSAQDCHLNSDNIEIVQEAAKHSEWKIAAEIQCKAGFEGQSASINLSKLFPTLKILNIEFISEKSQKSATLKNGKGTINFE